MSRFLTVLLSLAFLVGAPPLGFSEPAQAQATICPNGVIVPAGEPCRFTVTHCKDGTRIPSQLGLSKEEYCASRGGTKDFEPLAPAPEQPAPAAPAPAASTSKCTDGTAIPSATVAKGRNAMASFCATHGGIKGSAGGTR